MEVVTAINNISASSPPVVRLLRHLVLLCLQLNAFIYAVHNPGTCNKLADALSCFQWDEFHVLAPAAMGHTVSPGAVEGRIEVAAELIRDSLSAVTWEA